MCVWNSGECWLVSNAMPAAPAKAVTSDQWNSLVSRSQTRMRFINRPSGATSWKRLART